MGKDKVPEGRGAGVCFGVKPWTYGPQGKFENGAEIDDGTSRRSKNFILKITEHEFYLFQSLCFFSLSGRIGGCVGENGADEVTTIWVP